MKEMYLLFTWPPSVFLSCLVYFCGAGWGSDAQASLLPDTSCFFLSHLVDFLVNLRDILLRVKIVGVLLFYFFNISQQCGFKHSEIKTH